MTRDLLQPLKEGLFCTPGGFHIDPLWPVAQAVVTHAHSDHARAGSGEYHVAAAGLDLMRERLGAEARLIPHAYGEPFTLGEVQVSLHPAGHILGSAQVRMQHASGVTVVSGDYKRDPDPTCAPFEPVPCDAFVTESTFALPVYRWPPMRAVIDDVLVWLDECAQRKVPAVLFCYALGKAQRLLAELAARTQRTVYLHGALLRLVNCYRDAGVAMLPTEPVSESARGRDFAGELILAPPSAAGSAWMKRFANASTGFASGWMQIRGNRRRRGYDRGFVVSDHVDWQGLLLSIEQSRASRIYVTHGDGEALIRFLREQGHDAQPLRLPRETPQDDG